MTEKTYKVGDVVAWAEVPDGAMVRDVTRDAFDDEVQVCISGYGCTVAMCSECKAWSPEWMWSGCSGNNYTIIALNLTGQETAADLQRLAEVFEVREALCAFIRTSGEVHAAMCAFLLRKRETDRITAEEAATVLAERLHAAGWRPGDTAERAAELLRGAP
jgi:hypothetical protein